MNKVKLQKGDKVLVLTGKDKGKSGVIERVFTKTRSVLISKVNIVKKHTKVSKKNPSGGVVETERPVSISNVQLICPSCGKKTRVGYSVGSGGKKRVCKKCDKAIEIVKNEKKEK